MTRKVLWLLAWSLLCVFGLYGCANLWKFQTLQDTQGTDGGPPTDATMPPPPPIEGGDVVVPADDVCTSVCKGQCLDFTSDHGNCGGCGNACLTSEICENGKCVCGDNETVCGTGPNALCVDTMTDQGNCGS
jgi:hypothetical protein